MIPKRTWKDTQIWTCFIIHIPPSNWWRNRKSQPRNWNLPLDILQIKPFRMVQTDPYGQICSQHPTSLHHQQISILPHNGIQTTSTPWHHQQNQPSHCRKMTKWTHQSKGWSLCSTWTHQTNYEKLNPIKIHPFYHWRQGMAWSQKPLKKCHQPQICRKKGRTLQNHKSPLFPVISTRNPEIMENTSSIPHITPHPLQRKCYTWPKLPTTTTWSDQWRRRIQSGVDIKTSRPP